MRGKLYGVGVGPGDPELMTLKGKRILSEVETIAVPKTAADRDSLALSIAGQAVAEGKEVMEFLFPMTYDEALLQESWEKAVEGIRQRLDQGKDVAFITLGDPTVYSTYLYLHHLLHEEGYATEIIPGVTSFCASAAALGIGLGENKESIAVIPSVYECENLMEVLKSFETIVLMKVSKSLPRLKQLLEKEGLLERSALVIRCGMEDQRLVYDWASLETEKISYFSTMIVKKSGVIQP